ncbi:MAG TPA: alpha/beta fold hydrolase [Acidimicrobiales bacterium]|nr:alpha/beta fold hydrolase [Acidimicrobiales bacterium]
MLKAFANGQLFGVASGAGRPSVLALHGWARTSADFAATLDGLDAIALDLPGFGATPAPPEPWGAARYAEAVAAVLDELALPAVVLGHSFGGRVAVHLAAAHPEAVAGLVLTGAPLVRRPGTAARKPALAYRVGRALHRRHLLPESRMEALRRRYGSRDYLAASGVMRGVHVKVVNETYEGQLAAVACPVALVWGDDDAEVPVAVAEAAAGHLANATLTLVPGAGHLTPLTAPAALRDAVVRVRAGAPKQR